MAEERARIARDLHDIVAHSLSVIVLQAHGGEYALDHDPGRTREALRTIGTTGSDALDEIRQLVLILRGNGDDDVGSDHAVAAVVERARAAGMAVNLIVDGEPDEMPGGVALAVYRIVQESLTNTLKHAGPAPTATVRVAYRPGAVDLEITDDGLAATRQICAAGPLPRVLVLTTFDTDAEAFAALHAGASGFLLKSVPPDELLSAIRVVAGGEAVVAPRLTRRLLDRFAGRLTPSSDDPAAMPGLTDREKEVLLLVAQGLSNPEIGGRLQVAEATVKTHIGRILTKLGLRDRVQAVVFAYESGLVRPGDT